MKKMNKLQRYTAYCILLHEVQKGGTFVCNIFENELTECYDGYDCLECLPEFKNKKPKGAYLAFWNVNKYGREKRIEALKQCIEETHP